MNVSIDALPFTHKKIGRRKVMNAIDEQTGPIYIYIYIYQGLARILTLALNLCLSEPFFFGGYSLPADSPVNKLSSHIGLSPSSSKRGGKKDPAGDYDSSSVGKLPLAGMDMFEEKTGFQEKIY